MSSRDVLYAIIVMALAWTGDTYIKAKSEENRVARLGESKKEITQEVLGHLKFASEQETERMKLLYSVAQKNHITQEIEEEAEQLYAQKIKAAAKAERSVIAQTANIMQKLCLRYDAFFQLACNGDGWMVSALKTVDGEITDIISVIVETNPWGAPLLCKGIRNIADMMHFRWQLADQRRAAMESFTAALQFQKELEVTDMEGLGR